MVRTSLTALVLLTGLVYSSCRKHKMNDSEMDKNINYPAAYVVNGEDATISVIKLSDNAVSETIELMGNNNGMAMWPHHIYKNQTIDMTYLTIALPGMDLSAGHAGGMPGMKGRILIMDAVKGITVKELEVPEMNHNAVYSPNGKELWTSQMSTEGKILVYDATTYALKNTIAVGKEPAEVTFSADGSKAYVANGGDDNVMVINPATKAVIATISVGNNPVAAWVGYDGRMYVDNEDGNSVSIISVITNTVKQTINLGFKPGSVAHNNWKKELWVTDPNNGKVHYWNWDEVQSEWVHGGLIKTGAGAHAIAFTSDSNTAYVTNQLGGTVSIINVEDHSKIKDLAVGKKPNGILIKY